MKDKTQQTAWQNKLGLGFVPQILNFRIPCLLQQAARCCPNTILPNKLCEIVKEIPSHIDLTCYLKEKYDHVSLWSF